LRSSFAFASASAFADPAHLVILTKPESWHLPRLCAAPQRFFCEKWAENACQAPDASLSILTCLFSNTYIQK
jgi:hypothetical protein